MCQENKQTIPERASTSRVISNIQPLCHIEIQRPRNPLGSEDAHILPLLPERADTNNRARLALDILDLQELVLLAECEEVREERVEVALAAQVQDLLVVCVVEVREDAEELAVDVLDCRGKVLREVAAWKRGR